MRRSPFIHYLKLRFNNILIQHICICYKCNGLLLLDVAHNLVEMIKMQCFQSFSLLKSLILNDNVIRDIEDQSFSNLKNLKFVNLSNNNILNIPQYMFYKGISVKLISLRNNPFMPIHKNAFQNMKVEIIDSTSYQICCIMHQNVKCNADKPWYISCSDLLSSSLMKLFFVSISIVIVCINSVSILLNIVTRKSNICYSIPVISVNITDIFCGIYLCIIWMTDFYFRGRFISNESHWRSSSLCFTAFGVSLWFSIVTPIILFFLSLSRLMVVINPLDTRFMKRDVVIKYLLILMLVSMSISMILTFLMKLFQEKLPLNLCLPFVDPTNSILLIKLIAWSVAFVQTMISIVIIALHLFLVQNLRHSQKMAKSSAENSNKSIIMQLALITTSNIICWVPTNVIYLTSLFLQRYPTDLVIWTTILVTPLNSVVNPAVFAATSVRRLGIMKNFSLFEKLTIKGMN